MMLIIPSESDSFKATLRRKIDELRRENDQRAKDRDFDVRRECGPYAAALDAISDFIDDYERNPPR